MTTSAAPSGTVRPSTRTDPILACGRLRYREAMRWLARWVLLIGGAAVLFAGSVALIVVESRSMPVEVGIGAAEPEAQTGLGIAVSLIVVGFVAILLWL